MSYFIQRAIKPAIFLLLLLAVLASLIQPRSDLETPPELFPVESIIPLMADLDKPKPEYFPAEFITPLMAAAQAGRVDDVRRLLHSGADVNESVEDLGGLNALMLASWRGHVEVVKILLNAGADPNASGGIAHVGYYTPLVMAVRGHKPEVLEVIDTLIAGGARLNPQPPFDESPLDVAIDENDIEMIRALLQRGSDVNWEDGYGRTALETAVTNGNRKVEVVKLVLDAGGDPNKPRIWSGDDCFSILQFLDNSQKMATYEPTEEIRRLIIQAGGKKYAKKSHGEPCKPWKESELSPDK